MLEHTNYSIAVLSYNHPDLTSAKILSVLQLGFMSSKLYLIHNGSEAKHRNMLMKSLRPEPESPEKMPG